MMSDCPEPPLDTTDENAMRHLLRASGPREPVPAARTARVRAVVRAEWEGATSRRVRRQRRILLASALVVAAAALVLIAGRSAVVTRRAVPVGESVATVERAAGVPRRVTQDAGGVVTTALARHDVVRTGEWIETDALARLSLRFAHGASVRLDIASRARLLSPRVLELTAGAVYVDSGGGLGGFEVRTGSATARDIGTQFEVRVFERTLRLRVRSGVVELSDRRRSVTGRAGTEITLVETGAVSRPVAVHGQEWAWTGLVSPPLEIEGVPLDRVLDRMAREEGWTLHYADSALATEASAIILHGSVSNLSSRDALGVVLVSSGLGHRLEDGQLSIVRGDHAK